ncbi:MAG: L,D-transpeptidase [Ignavibacteria bacterium]
MYYHPEDLSGKKLKDTVYTDLDNWLELRINEQMVYQHWRDGRTVKYPVSTAQNKGGDPVFLETPDRVYLLFFKSGTSSVFQFNAANMYNFMPFNQGIDFHYQTEQSYYVHLGVRPSSHGCIRMKHEDAKKLFADCPKRNIYNGFKKLFCKTVAFAPQGFKNEKENIQKMNIK